MLKNNQVLALTSFDSQIVKDNFYMALHAVLEKNQLNDQRVKIYRDNEIANAKKLIASLLPSSL